MTETNPYQAPQLANNDLADASEQAEPTTVGSRKRGWPEPIPFAMLGLGLALGVFATLAMAFMTESSWALAAIVPIPLLRLVWVVWCIALYRRYSTAWQSSERTTVLIILYSNCLLLVIDTVLILLLGSCVYLISSYNTAN